MNGLWMPYVAEQGRVHVGLAGTGRILCGTTIRLTAAEWSDAIDLLDKRGPCRLCLRCLRAHAADTAATFDLLDPRRGH